MNLVEAIAHLGLTNAVPGLSASQRRSDDLIAQMRDELAGYGAGGTMDVLACGSLARREYTLGSDIDWLVVVNAMPEHPAAARNLVVRVKECVSKEAAKEGSGGKNPVPAAFLVALLVCSTLSNASACKTTLTKPIPCGWRSCMNR